MDADEEAALLDAIQKWVDKEVRPVVQKYDHDDVWPEEIVNQMVEMGLSVRPSVRNMAGWGCLR